MSPLIHLLISMVASIVLFPFFGWNVLFVIIGGVLIDIDHYLFCCVRHKDSNFLNAYKYLKKNPEEVIGALFLFHSIEFLVLLFILSFFFEWVLLMAVGVGIHYVLDVIFEYSLRKRLVKAWSVFVWLRGRR